MDVFISFFSFSFSLDMGLQFVIFCLILKTFCEICRQTGLQRNKMSFVAHVWVHIEKGICQKLFEVKEPKDVFV